MKLTEFQISIDCRACGAPLDLEASAILPQDLDYVEHISM